MQFYTRTGSEKNIPLPVLPSFGMHPIYPLRVPMCMCVCVSGWVGGYTSVCVARWQEGFQHINITLPHKETQASVRAFSASNKHGSSSTRGVRGSAYTKMEFQRNTALLLADKWQSSQLCNPMWAGFVYNAGADVVNVSWAAVLRPDVQKRVGKAGCRQALQCFFCLFFF